MAAVKPDTRKPRSPRSWPVLAAVLLWPAAPSTAAGQTVVVGDSGPSVVVNRSVIESLPPPPVLPQVRTGRAGDRPAGPERTAASRPPGIVVPGTIARPPLAFVDRAPAIEKGPPAPDIPETLLSTITRDSLLPDRSVSGGPRPAARAASVSETAAAATGDAATAGSAATVSAAAEPYTATQARLLFDAGSADLPGADATLLAPLVTALASSPTSRARVTGYATTQGDSRVRARRLSLSRALAVRSHLISLGIDGMRIDVQALGDKASGGPADRVDVMISGGSGQQ